MKPPSASDLGVRITSIMSRFTMIPARFFRSKKPNIVCKGPSIGGNLIGTITIIHGWWLTYPSEKYESPLGLLFPIYGKIKNVPNHQPDLVFNLFNVTKYTKVVFKMTATVVHISIYFNVMWDPLQTF